MVFAKGFLPDSENEQKYTQWRARLYASFEPLNIIAEIERHGGTKLTPVNKYNPASNMALVLGISTVLRAISRVMPMTMGFLSGPRLIESCKMGMLDLSISGVVNAFVLVILPISWRCT